MKKIFIFILSVTLIFSACDHPVAYQTYDTNEYCTYFYYGGTRFCNKDNIYYFSRLYSKECKSFTVPDRVYGERVCGIWEEAFGDFENLEELVIPQNITMMHYRSFYNCCRKLKTVYFYSEIPPSIYPRNVNYYNDYSLLSYNASFKIYVPAGSVSAYKNASQWEKVKDLIYPME